MITSCPTIRALLLYIPLFICQAIAAPVDGTDYYLKQQGGGGDGLTPGAAFSTAKDAIGALTPGDTLYIMGELTNDSYNTTYTFTGDLDDPHLWHSENTLKINELKGLPDKPITITSYDGSTVLRGDGGNILRITKSSYLRIENLHIHGEVERIPLSTAKAVQFVYRDETKAIQYRVDPALTAEEIENLVLPDIGSNIERVSYTDTRGLYMSDSQYVELRNNYIHHVPGTGLRVAKCEFVDVVGNEIHDASRRSYSGTHALVATYTKDELPANSDWGDYRVRIVGNLVHDNYNEIFSWVGTKTFIHPRIDEGKGISLQRNQEFTNGGRILVANNIAYWNGFSGIHSNDGNNIDFIGNTAYMNSYTNTVTYSDIEQKGKNIGISMSGGKDCKIINNIAFIDTDWGAFPISVTNDTISDIEIHSNLVYGQGSKLLSLSLDQDLLGLGDTALVADPIFTDPEKYEFSVQEGSPALGTADPSPSLAYDFYGIDRSATAPTIGAIEASSDGGGAIEASSGDGKKSKKSKKSKKRRG